MNDWNNPHETGSNAWFRYEQQMIHSQDVGRSMLAQGGIPASTSEKESTNFSWGWTIVILGIIAALLAQSKGMGTGWPWFVWVILFITPGLVLAIAFALIRRFFVLRIIAIIAIAVVIWQVVRPVSGDSGVRPTPTQSLASGLDGRPTPGTQPTQLTHRWGDSGADASASADSNARSGADVALCGAIQSPTTR
jgi:hypothetical protein